MKSVKDIVKKETGYKGELEFSLEDLKVSVPIRYKRLTSKDITNPIIFKDEKGDEVIRKFIGEPKHLEWRKVNNPDQQAEGEISAYQVVNGKEKKIKPFERTESFEIKKIMPRDFKENFLIEKTYEIWSEDESELFKIADYLYKKDAVGLCVVNIAKGYDTQYLGIIEPRFIENKFGILLFLTKKQLLFEHLAEIGVEMKKIEKPEQLEIVKELGL